jgi:hypothetical protein
VHIDTKVKEFLRLPADHVAHAIAELRVISRCAFPHFASRTWPSAAWRSPASLLLPVGDLRWLDHRYNANSARPGKSVHCVRVCVHCVRA